MKKISKLIVAVCAAVIGLTCQPVLAVVIDFEDLPHADELTGVGPVYSSQGYTLTYEPAVGEPYPVGFMTVGPTWRFNGQSAAFFANSGSATTTLTADDNNMLTLKAIDLAALNGDKDVSVRFIGTTADGTTVQKTFKLRGQKMWRKYHLPPGFRNLRSVSWTQGDFPHMFDNIHVVSTSKDNDRRHLWPIGGGFILRSFD